jgi:condensin complex subunit 2
VNCHAIPNKRPTDTHLYTNQAQRSEATLLKDFTSLALKKLDVDFAVDPLFKKTSADFDEGGARGLLLNHLNLDQDCKIIFDSSDARPEDDDDVDTTPADNATIDTIAATNDNDDDDVDNDSNDNDSNDSEDNNDEMDLDEAHALFDNQIAMGSQLITMDDLAEQDYSAQESIDITTLKGKRRWKVKAISNV